MGCGRIDRRGFMKGVVGGAAGLAMGAGSVSQGKEGKRQEGEGAKILNYNSEMEYRRLGKTGLMVSAVCLGGHWKRVEVMRQGIGENRKAVVRRCIEAGMNYIDCSTGAEAVTYSRALGPERKRVYLGVSNAEHEPRNEDFRTARKLVASLEEVLSEAKLEYADVWRITCCESGSTHSFATSCEIVKALETSKKQGKARFIGISSHDRGWLRFMVEYFSALEVVLFPYTARTKPLPEKSLLESLRARDVGAFGIKPFANAAIFKGTSAPGNPEAEEDDRRGRLALRHILENPQIVPIPGLISPEQVENAAKAVREGRELEKAEAWELKELMEQSWAALGEGHDWLKQWEYL